MTSFSPYLSYKTETRDAFAFYQSVLGGEAKFSTFADYHAPVDADEQQLIMHAELKTDQGYLLFAADSPRTMGYTAPGGISLALMGDDEALLTAYFEGLAAGGHIEVPLEKAPWGDSFGQIRDKFGITWMVNISAKPAQ